MQLIRKCKSLPAMHVHTFSIQSVWALGSPVDGIPALEKTGISELFPLEFAEWITRRVLAHFIFGPE